MLSESEAKWESVSFGVDKKKNLKYHQTNG